MVKYIEAEIIEWSMDLIEEGTQEHQDAHFDLWPDGMIVTNEEVTAVFGSGTSWLSAYTRAVATMGECGVVLVEEQIENAFHHCRWFDEKQEKPEGRCFVRFMRITE